MRIVKPINIPKIILSSLFFHLGIKLINRGKDCRKLGDFLNSLFR